MWSELYIWKRPAVEEVRGGRGAEGVVRALHLETSCRGGGEGREGGRVWSELYIWKRPAVEVVRGGREGGSSMGWSSGRSLEGVERE